MSGSSNAPGSPADDLLKEAQGRSDQFRRLAEASIAINATLSVPVMLDTLTREAREIVGADEQVEILRFALDAGIKMERARAADHDRHLGRRQELEPLAVEAPRLRRDEIGLGAGARRFSRMHALLSGYTKRK